VRAFLEELQVGAVALDELEEKWRAETTAALERAVVDQAPSARAPAKASIAPDVSARPDYAGSPCEGGLVMREAINAVLANQLKCDSRVVLYGQDIEDPKGDVFGVTSGLSTAFPGRVLNAPLSESTIVGTAIGRALAGQRPVAFVQFADFLPLAYNQIVSELGSMFWRTNGGWECPVIVMASCGGYRPGLGPFHSQTFESILAQTPGIDVVMPCSAGDAAGLLNAAFASRRPTVFLYPKACLNLPDRATSKDIAQHFVLPGRARRLARGNDLTLVTYGNPVAQCLEAIQSLEEHGFGADLFDLRSISPWDETEVIASVRRTGRLIVVHEDNRSAGFGAEVVSTMVEKAGVPFSACRVTRPDTFVPFNFANQCEVLPSHRSVLEACAALVGFSIKWDRVSENSKAVSVLAIGSGPADHEVTVVDIRPKVGDRLVRGELVAVVEATKAAVEISSTVSGTVVEVAASEGQRVSVGSPILVLEPDADVLSNEGNPLANESQKAKLIRRPPLGVRVSRRSTGAASPAAIVGIAESRGRRIVKNAEIAADYPNRTAEEIEYLTGIAERRWIGPGETSLSLASDAVRKVLAETQTTIHDIDLVIAASCTPDRMTPSLASRVAAEVAGACRPTRLPAYDINAACSGYLFALSHAFDFLDSHPRSRVLVVTSEVLSPLLNAQDFATVVLFADAASATLLTKAEGASNPLMVFERPLISGQPEPGTLLSVPLPGNGYVEMDGKVVFGEAIRSMMRTLEDACAEAGLGLEDLDLIVPHQANTRIISALERRANRPVANVMSTTGNTSSSSIPLALIDVLPRYERDTVFGMVAFGGGITHAAAVARTGSG
jgi:2-oxoisovalerate dehydrogenase E1 component